ncbi:hypothetical protein ACOMHN_031550 [Nucella lapillus]
MKRVESEAGRECEEKEIGDSYCTDGPTGPEGGEVSSEGTNEEGGDGEGDRGLVDGGREVESERSDSTKVPQCARPLRATNHDLIPCLVTPAPVPAGSADSSTSQPGAVQCHRHRPGLSHCMSASMGSGGLHG